MKHTKLNQSGFSHLIVAAILLLVGVIGFSAWRVVNKKQANNEASSSISSAQQTPLPDDLSALKPIDEVIGLAAQEIGTRLIAVVELEHENGVLVYSIKLNDGTVLIFNAQTGARLQLSSADSPETDKDKPLPANFKPAVTIQAAVQTAKEKRPNQAVSKVELELEDGIVVFSVRFADKSKVDVDALTGAVLRVRELGKPEVKLRDNDNDIDEDKVPNGVDKDDDNDGIDNDKDDDKENDGLMNKEDNDDDNDGINDVEDKDSDNSGSGSSNSGSNRR